MLRHQLLTAPLGPDATYIFPRGLFPVSSLSPSDLPDYSAISIPFGWSPACRCTVFAAGVVEHISLNPPKAGVIAQDIGVDILAVQETHLAFLPLEWAHGTCRNLGLRLHHGHPVPPLLNRVDGRSCGVGFVSRQGVALTPVPPVGAAWRRLHSMGRLHGIRVPPPRAGLPHGLLLFSAYAPLQIRAQSVVRDQFVNLMLEVVHSLDMQTPTILFGDFNGSVDPPADFLGATSQRCPVCPLLAGLLGPGGALCGYPSGFFGRCCSMDLPICG